MESWMVAILIVGAIIMFSFWGLIAFGNRELKKKDRVSEERNRPDLDTWENDDDVDDNAVYDTNGKRIR